MINKRRTEIKLRSQIGAIKARKMDSKERSINAPEIIMDYDGVNIETATRLETKKRDVELE